MSPFTDLGLRKASALGYRVCPLQGQENWSFVIKANLGRRKAFALGYPARPFQGQKSADNEEMAQFAAHSIVEEGDESGAQLVNAAGQKDLFLGDEPFAGGVIRQLAN